MQWKWLNDQSYAETRCLLDHCFVSSATVINVFTIVKLGFGFDLGFLFFWHISHLQFMLFIILNKSSSWIFLSFFFSTKMSYTKTKIGHNTTWNRAPTKTYFHWGKIKNKIKLLSIKIKKFVITFNKFKEN